MKSTTPDPRSPKKAWDEQHQLQLDHPLTWWLKADSLIAAFEVLIEADERKAKKMGLMNTEIDGPAYMLAGFAIENLLKGQLVAQRKHRDQNGNFMLKSHDLRRLAVDADYKLGEEDNRLLERIEAFTIWAARYPVPLDSTPMRPRRLPAGVLLPSQITSKGKTGTQFSTC